MKNKTIRSILVVLLVTVISITAIILLSSPSADSQRKTSTRHSYPHHAKYTTRVPSNSGLRKEIELKNVRVKNLFQAGKIMEAKKLGREAMSQAEDQFGKFDAEVGASSLNLAGIYRLQGNYAEAIPLYAKARKILERNFGPNHYSVAFCANNTGLCYQEIGKYDEAEQQFKTAKNLFETILLEHKRERGSKKLSSLEATEIEKALGVLLSNYGALCRKWKGDYTLAESLLIKSIEMIKSVDGDEASRLMQPMNNLALVYWEQGEFSKAEGLFIDSLHIAEKSLADNHPEVAVVLSNVAAFYSHQGKYNEAEVILEKAITITENTFGRQHPRVALFHQNLGAIYKNQERFTEAEDVLCASVDILEKVYKEDHLDILTAVLTLASFYTDVGEYEKATDLYSRIIATSEKSASQNKNILLASLLNIAVLKYYCREYETAEQFFRRTIQLIKDTYGPDHYSLSDPLFGLAMIRDEQGDYLSAIKLYIEGMDVLEKSSDVANNDYYSKEVYKAQKVFCTLFLQALENLNKVNPREAQKYITESFRAMELSRSRQFRDELSKSTASKFSHISEIDRMQERKLDFTIRALREKIEIENAKPPDERNSEWLTELNMDLSELTVKRVNFEQTISKKYPKYAQFKNPIPLNVKYIQEKLLKEGELILSLWIGDNQLYACLIGKINFSFFVHSVSEENLRFKISQFMGCIEQKIEVSLYKEVAFLLYQEVLSPFVKDLDLSDVNLLYIIPHGVLAKLPFDALVEDTHGNDYRDLSYVMNKVDIVYAPSVSTLNIIRQTNVSNFGNNINRHPVLLFGDPIYTAKQAHMIEALDSQQVLVFNIGMEDTAQQLIYNDQSLNKMATRAIKIQDDGKINLVPLPGSRKEVEYISQLFYGTKNNPNIFTGTEANESTVKWLNSNKKLANYKYIHFATHGILPGKIDGLSEPCLALSIYGDKSEDGFLKMGEIFSLEMAADVIILSACETAVEGDVELAQDISGLARAFFYAGTRNVIATFWSISDVGTFEFMVKYYKGLKNHPENTIVKALNQAKREQKQGEYSHPYFWASYMLIGDGY